MSELKQNCDMDDELIQLCTYDAKMKLIVKGYNHALMCFKIPKKKSIFSAPSANTHCTFEKNELYLCGKTNTNLLCVVFYIAM